ncbi:hypothetical protein B0H10DRAFT_2083931 [Mycena sp. CBHHK59/15]|nr:hypothetical protein B0H10DRAFT_2083931 [Mycena sp. CBHHK59/15]
MSDKVHSSPPKMHFQLLETPRVIWLLLLIRPVAVWAAPTIPGCVKNDIRTTSEDGEHTTTAILRNSIFAYTIKPIPCCGHEPVMTVNLKMSNESETGYCERGQKKSLPSTGIVPWIIIIVVIPPLLFLYCRARRSIHVLPCIEVADITSQSSHAVEEVAEAEEDKTLPRRLCLILFLPLLALLSDVGLQRAQIIVTFPLPVTYFYLL